MELTLQAVKHREVIKSLNVQLESRKGSDALQETILQLQEKCDDLEKMLQEKNVEIEENDDRFIQCVAGLDQSCSIQSHI